MVSAQNLPKVFYCPTYNCPENRRQTHHLGYGINKKFVDGGVATLKKLRLPSKRLILACHAANIKKVCSNAGGSGYHYTVDNQSYGAMLATSYTSVGIVNHDGRAPVLFASGNVRSLTGQQLLVPTDGNGGSQYVPWATEYAGGGFRPVENPRDRSTF